LSPTGEMQTFLSGCVAGGPFRQRSPAKTLSVPEECTLAGGATVKNECRYR